MRPANLEVKETFDGIDSVTHGISCPIDGIGNGILDTIPNG